MTTLQRRGVIMVLLALFSVTFLLRAHHPLSRSSYWLVNAEAFHAALDARDWARTYQDHHPGVTAMAIAGLALRGFDASRGTRAERVFRWVFPSYATESGRRIAVAVMGLAVVLAALNVVIAVLVSRLSSWSVGLTAGWLIAVAPFTLAYGRTMRVDALLSMLMLLSALLLLFGLSSGQRCYLVWSGLVAGLSVLTKAPAALLALFAALALIVYRIRDERGSRPGWSGRRWREYWRSVGRPWLVWLLCALAPLGLWPATWVDPVGVLHRLVKGSAENALQPHGQPIFFAGQLFSEHAPGPFFYPVTLAFDTSFITLTLALVGVGHYTIWRRRTRPPLDGVAFWLLMAYAACLTLGMSLAGKQVGGRYLLPVHLVLELAAAIGLVGLVYLATRSAGRGRRWARPLFSVGTIVLVVLLQALVALSYAPDYGAHHNHLLGGNRVADRFVTVTSENEGIMRVADYLNRVPDVAAQRVTAAARPGEHLEQYFSGRQVRDRAASDYVLFDGASIQRRIRPHEWEAAWQEYRHRRPAMVVSFDGVEVFWLYARPAAVSWRNARSEVQPVSEEHGWNGWVPVAWLWSMALAAGTWWVVRNAAR